MPRERRPHIETKKTRIMTGQINCHQSNWRYQYRPLLRWLSDFQTLFCCQAQSPGGKIVAQPTNCISYRPYTFVIGIKRHMRRTICLVQFLRWILSTNSSICLHKTPPRQRWKNIGIYQPWEVPPVVMAYGARGLRGPHPAPLILPAGKAPEHQTPFGQHGFEFENSNRKMEVKQSPPKKCPSLISRKEVVWVFQGWDSERIVKSIWWIFPLAMWEGPCEKKKDTSDYTDKEFQVHTRP